MKNQVSASAYSKSKKFLNKWFTLGWNCKWQDNDHEVIALSKLLLSENKKTNEQLQQAKTIIQNFKSYGMIHIVTGVHCDSYTHEELIHKADEWLTTIEN